MADLSEECAICFWPNHPIAKNWVSDERSYNFPPMCERGVTVRTCKRADKRLEFTVTLPGRKPLHLGGAIPKRSLPNTLRVDIVWKGPVVSLHLDSELVAQSAPQGSTIIPFKR